MTTTRQRYQHFDILKGIAILLVIIGHAFTYGRGEFRNPLFHFITLIHMPIFVFIAGYFGAKPIDWTSKGIRSYWVKKAEHLLLPLILIPACYLLFFEINLGRTLLDTEYHSGYWFTWAMFEIFAVAFLFRALDKKINPKANWRTRLLIALLSIVFVYATKIGLSATYIHTYIHTQPSFTLYSLGA